MKKNFNNTFSNFIKIVFLLVLCFGIAFGIVWPLWKFSTTFSKAYTIVVCVLLILVILYLIITKIRKTAPAKTIQFFTNFAVILAGLAFAIYLVISGKRLLALFEIIVLIAIELVINHLFSRKLNA